MVEGENMKETRKMKFFFVNLSLIIFLITRPLAGINSAMIGQKTLKSENEDRDLLWYSDNLTPEDRKKIRTAMDHAIPRDRIIEDLIQGHAIKIATPIGANQLGYDPTIQVREYNPNKALDLMEEVFGYRYNASSDLAKEREYYFEMELMSPNTRVDRMEWAALITKSFSDIGIDVTLHYISWNLFISHIFELDEPGLDYAHGGYDGYFIGWGLPPEPDLTNFFMRENMPPIGCNTAYIINDEVEDILIRSVNELELTNRLLALKEFQQWFQDKNPYFIILQGYNLWALDSNLEGVDYTGLNYPNYRNWTHPTESLITVQSPSTFFNMNPLITHSRYDFLAMRDNFDSLINRYPQNLTEYYGNLAESWTISADNLMWTFKIRDGIYFNDGTKLTVDDVIFTYEKLIDPDVDVRDQRFYMTHIKEIKKIDSHTVQFTLTEFYLYMKSLFTVPILSKAQMEQIPSVEWKNDADTNTKYAPMGTGTYVMDKANTDVSKGVVTMILNPFYDGSLRDPAGQFKNPNLIPTIKVKVYDYDIYHCVKDLTSDALDIIDSQSGLSARGQYIDEINRSNCCKLHTSLEWGHQELVINNCSPIWGMNPNGTTKIPNTNTSMTSTTTSTNMTSSMSTEAIPSISVPSFSFITSLSLLIVLLIYKRKHEREF